LCALNLLGLVLRWFLSHAGELRGRLLKSLGLAVRRALLHQEGSPMPFRPDIGTMPADALRALAPSGTLRAGINMSNFLLVSSRTPDGGPAGVSPDMARAIADNLGLALEYVTYPNPGVLADAATRDEWDIALIGAEPQRAEVISFTPAYTEIEATYLVPAGSPLQAISDVDTAGTRIAVAERTAYGLWLDRNIRNAELVHAVGLDGSLSTFLDQKLDALAGLRPRLIKDVQSLPGARLLDGCFMAVQQAVGVPRPKQAALEYLVRFVEAARTSGFVADLIRKHGVEGLSVA
jgi:polar amino acid transport system substrate-binding protein